MLFFATTNYTLIFIMFLTRMNTRNVIKMLATYHYAQYISVEHIQSIYIYLSGFSYDYRLDLFDAQLISLKPNNSKNKTTYTYKNQ